MTKSKSRDEDKDRPSRVDKTHGGNIVEAISRSELKDFNDADCKHEKLVRDLSEKDFIAFMCANPRCAIVVLYDKH